MDEDPIRIQSLEAELERLRRELDALRRAGAPDPLMRTLMDQTPDHIYFKDLQGRFVRASRAVARSFRLADPEELLGKSDFDFFSEPHARRTSEDEQEIIRTGLPKIDIEEAEAWPDGRVTWVSSTKMPCRDAEGNIVGTFGISRDITARKRAEESLRISEAALREVEVCYRELFNNNTDAIFWIRVEEDGRFVVESINPAEEIRLGLSCAEVAGKAVEELLPPELAGPVIDNYRRCLALGTPLRYEEQADLQGAPKTFQTLLIPIRDARGAINRFIGFSQDITQSKQAEEALRQAQKLESLGLLAGGIAHDFNNLLTTMLGNLDLARMQCAPGSPAMPYLESLERTVLRAADLTRQMLAYSGRGRFVVKLHDLNQVVRELTHLLSVSISKKVAIRYDLADVLLPIEADAAQIQQVIMNLVTNASEAIGDAVGVIDIATRRQALDAETLRSAFPGQGLEPGEYAILEVADSGTGIPPEIRERIFDPFFSTKQSGRGLGLSAMQGILRGHRAGIRIHSEVGHGSVFSIFFPAAPAPAKREEEAPSPKPQRELKGRALLVDDEPGVRASTTAMLENLGLQVVQAVDGKDGLERFAAEGGAFDFVLLDLTMPRMDGREAFKELRRIRADIPVVLYSGYSEHEHLQEILSQGRTAFLQKPFLLRDLRRAVRQVLPS